MTSLRCQWCDTPELECRVCKRPIARGSRAYHVGDGEHEHRTCPRYPKATGELVLDFTRALGA